MASADIDGEAPPLVPEGVASSAKVQEQQRIGNAAYEAGHYDEAIEAYSAALREKSADTPALLSSRSAAFARLSRQLREIPAAESEARAIYGLDPLALAELALKDAEKLAACCNTWPKSFERKGAALHLLERYEEARDAFLEGLQLHPTHAGLQRALKELGEEEGRRSPVLGKRKMRSVQRTDDLDCTLCLKLLYNPVTTSCGHTFCRTCLARTFDHGLNKCPMCRTVLFLSPRNFPVSVTLKNLLEKNFPEEYAERKAELEAEAITAAEVLPFFVMDVMLPMQKQALNIFEPRYRLMIRRVMEGDHRMGMVGYDPRTRSIGDVGCEVEITECEPLPDGRFYIEIEGRRRCKIKKTWDQDGYRVGEVDWLADEAVEPGSEEEKQIEELFEEVCRLSTDWGNRVLEAARRNRRRDASELVRQVESKPPTTDKERFSFWVASLLPIGPAERLAFLRTTSLQERLQGELSFLREGEQGCRLQ